LDEELELKIAWFIQGLSPSIASKVDLRPYLSFDDVCHLTIKVEKQLKVGSPFTPPLLEAPPLTLKLIPYPYRSML